MEIITILQSVWTVVVMILFLGIVIWTFRQGAKFNEVANLPIDDDDSVESIIKEKHHV